MFESAPPRQSLVRLFPLVSTCFRLFPLVSACFLLLFARETAEDFF